MCGIIAVAAERPIVGILLEGLKRLEYRGYDSSGLAVISDDALLKSVKSLGKVAMLEEHLKSTPINGRIGVAHTRWATHGPPSHKNAHPHQSEEKIAVVHNGIIENHDRLRQQLQEKGYDFESDTDSEIIAHLFYDYLNQGLSDFQAALALQDCLEGAFAIAIINANNPKELIAIRRGSPLVIGIGIEENYVASDQHALLPITQRFMQLEDGDIAKIDSKKITILDSQGKTVERKCYVSDLKFDTSGKGAYRHYMLKEIFEQPDAILNTLEGRLSDKAVNIDCFDKKTIESLDKVERIKIIACGTSYHAGMVAKYWFESFARLPCSVEIASEYRYRNPIVDKNTLFISISQSGETADTLLALKLAKSNGYLATLAICNVPESSLARESDYVMMTRAGIEIGVASTKAFTTQLTTLFLLVIAFSQRKKLTSFDQEIIRALYQLPEIIEQSFELDQKIKTLAQLFADKQHALFLGRGDLYPIALEGALKLKELSYIHAEGYPAGELKHGPLALVDEGMPVIAVAPNNELLEKLKSNLQEVRARGGQLFVFADSRADIKANESIHVLTMPTIHRALEPILYTIPLQLLAYHVAVIKGTDVDQPRNLAKSVTVE